jgi:hypothetical protein
MNRAVFGCLLSSFAFLALPPALRAEVAQWDFDGDLESSTGHAPLAEFFAAPGVGPDYEFESGAIGGDGAEVLRFERGTYFRVMPGMGPNGGGAYVNRYTLVMDVMFPDRSPSGGWASLLQTNEANANDGDWFIGDTGGLGISGNYGGSVPEGEWHRLALVVDLVAGTFTSFIDGVQVQQNTGEPLDGRFSLYSVNDGGFDGFSIFADESGDNAEGFINSLQFRDVALAPADVAALGGPSADGIPIPSDPRDCSFRGFEVAYDAASNSVRGTWLPLPGENGFRVFQGARQIGGDLPANATSFVDPSPPRGGAGVVYTLRPLRAGGAVERECAAAPIDTFACLSGLVCCADQAAPAVTLTWSPPTNVTVSGFSIRRGGVDIATIGGAASSYTDAGALAPGVYTYEVAVLSGGAPLCAESCRATVTGVPIGIAESCGGVLNAYEFDGDLKSSTGGRDLVPMSSPPIAAGGAPSFSFETAEIAGEDAQVCRYSRGTFFRLYTGLGPNGGGVYTNDYTLIMDVLFEAGAIDESGWAALFQTNEANANDGDWFVRGSDRGVGIDGNYGGVVEDDVWHRLALVLDSSRTGTFSTYLDGVLVQQNAGLALDDRFTLYSVNDGPAEGISIFADDSGDNSAGLVNSVQIRDIAMSAEEIAAFGGPSAEGIPALPPCPHALSCAVDQAAKTVTLAWNPGVGLPGDGFTLRRNGAAIASLPLTAATHTDSGLAPGVYVYELSLNDKDSGCINLPLSCQIEILGSRRFFDDFDAYANDELLLNARWQIRNVNAPLENAAWTVANPARRANPPTFNGRPSNGRFVISDSAFGGGDAAQNVPGSGMSFDIWSPSFSTAGAAEVWLHFDAAAQLNNNGDAVFDVAVSSDDGGSWTSVLERVSPGRTLEPRPEFAGNADGLYGRIHVDITGAAANKPSVRLRFRHLEPTWDWWVAIDNVLVDENAPAGRVAVLGPETFAAGIPTAWKAVSGPASDAVDPWSIEDSCSLSLERTGGLFPDAANGLQLHHLDDAFALVDPFCSAARADEYLITPPMDLSALSRVFLSFRSAAIVSGRAVAEVLVSLDGGASFHPAPVFTYNGGALSVPDEEPYFSEHSLEAPAAAGKANVAFAFHYRSIGSAAPPGTWWAIDDVSVTGETAPASPVFHRGDADGNGKLEITDAVRTLGYLYLGQEAPPCLDAADAHDNGSLEITDAVRVLGFLYLGQAPPDAPGPPPEPCGPDAGGELGCESYSGCAAQ